MAYDETTPNPVDLHVGLRVRARRKSLGLSQDALAKCIGLTFQQVQKYERGANRVSASMLWAIGKALDVPVVYFFSGYGEGDAQAFGEPSAEQSIGSFLTSAEGQELAASFPRIRAPRQRRKILELVKALADDGE
jgi:transcriptional regulator with XRE-family HTH domain